MCKTFPTWGKSLLNFSLFCRRNELCRYFALCRVILMAFKLANCSLLLYKRGKLVNNYISVACCMFGILILVILLIKQILRFFVANSLLLQFTHFFRQNSFGLILAYENKLYFSMSVGRILGILGFESSPYDN